MQPLTRTDIYLSPETKAELLEHAKRHNRHLERKQRSSARAIRAEMRGVVRRATRDGLEPRVVVQVVADYLEAA